MTRKLVHIRPSMCSTSMVPLLEIICKTLTEVIVCYFIILKVCSYTHQKMLEGMPSMYSLWTVLLVHWNDRKKFLSLKHSCRHLELSFWRANSFSCWYSHNILIYLPPPAVENNVIRETKLLEKVDSTIVCMNNYCIIMSHHLGFQNLLK